MRYIDVTSILLIFGYYVTRIIHLDVQLAYCTSEAPTVLCVEVLGVGRAHIPYAQPYYSTDTVQAVGKGCFVENEYDSAQRSYAPPRSSPDPPTCPHSYTRTQLSTRNKHTQ